MRTQWANIVPMRLHVVLDEDVVKEVDSKVGRRGRSKFIREAIEAKVEEDTRRLAALERLRGSMPDFAPYMTPEWIREESRRESEELDRNLEHYRRRPLK
jgi:Arc/MetJ-type ribon-helix-helix transcriptional regulator